MRNAYRSDLQLARARAETENMLIIVSEIYTLHYTPLLVHSNRRRSLMRIANCAKCIGNGRRRYRGESLSLLWKSCVKKKKKKTLWMIKGEDR